MSRTVDHISTRVLCLREIADLTEVTGCSLQATSDAVATVAVGLLDDALTGEVAVLARELQAARYSGRRGGKTLDKPVPVTGGEL